MSDERRERYAAALCAAEGLDWEVSKREYPCDAEDFRKSADAAMYVADVEYQAFDQWAKSVEAENTSLRAELAEEQAHRQRMQEEMQPVVRENARLRAELTAEHKHGETLMKVARKNIATISRVRALQGVVPAHVWDYISGALDGGTDG